MHNAMIGTTGMDQESHPAHDNSQYGSSSGWVDVNSYSQSPLPDYGSFNYMTTGLPPESLARIAPSPTTIQTHPQRSQSQAGSTQQSPQTPHHPQLPMLIMPSHAWPSMLTNPVTYSTPPMAIPAVAPSPTAAPVPAQPKPSRPTASTPRRTLTDDDRRRMCRYHEENPTAKQLDIGRMFGVERSTVSKVLRQKDKYLNPEDRSVSPVKRNKGKLPDIERALASWARKAQQSGMEITDSEIWEKARHFAHGVSGTDQVQKLGISWLEKFKQKHAIGQPRIVRRASETSIPNSAAKRAITSPLLPQSQAPNGISPVSPITQPSPLSGTRSDDELKDGLGSTTNIYGFRTDTFKRGNNQSTTSLSSAFTDAGTSSFSGSAVSPTGPFAFSPDSNVGGFLPTDQRHLPGGPESHFQRPRSQTFPTLDIECLSQQTTNPEPATPKYAISSTAPSSALESPGRELDSRHFGLTSVITSSPQLHHSSSNGNLGPNAAGLSANQLMSPPSPRVGSSPSSPTLEDARRGLDLALSYVQKSVSRYDEKDLMAVIHFFEGVGLRQYTQNMKGPGASMQTLSNLGRIPEGGEVEMTNAPPTTSAKLETMMA